MNPETQINIGQLLTEKYASLPTDLQSLVTSEDFRVRVANTTGIFNLNSEQSIAVENLTFFVVIGILDPKNFVANIQESLGVSEAEAREIGQAINGDIFRPVKDSIKKIYESDASGERGLEQNSAEPIQEISAEEKKVLAEGAEETSKYLEIIPDNRPRTESEQEGGLLRTQILSDIEKTEKPIVSTIAEEIIPQGSLDRDDLLKSIENPKLAPTAERTYGTMNAVMGPKASINRLETTPPATNPPQISQPSDVQNEKLGNIFEERLKRIISLPKEESDITPGRKAIQNDPYREQA